MELARQKQDDTGGKGCVVYTLTHMERTDERRSAFPP